MADVGIAMGQRGTRSAREVAAIVLVDDNFRSIVDAIQEGRRLFGDLQLAFQYLLLIHIPLVLTATLVPLAGYPLLYLPIHIVWLEAIIHPTALLAFQGASSAASSPVERGRARFFSRWQWVQTAVVGAVMTILLVATWERGLGAGGTSSTRARWRWSR